MNVSGASDLARLTMLQTRAINVRDALDRAATELTTGVKNSKYEATGGNLTRLFALERSLDRNKVFSETVSLTELRLDIMQEGLGQILKPAESLAIDIVTATGLGDVAASRIHAASSRAAFSDAVGVLNGTVAGQSLYAGTTTDRPALAPAADILAQLDAIAAGAPDAATAIAAINDYFDVASGSVPNFFGDGYVGSPDDLNAVEIGEGRRLDYAVRADQAELVATLRGHAMAAVVAGGAFAGDIGNQMALMAEAGSSLLAAKEGMLDLRARVGGSQFAVEQARAERISERDTLGLARAKIVAVDPLEAASAYQQLQVQLESVFTVTSRLANLRFSNFM
jgi:flagellar hook-associated protein 3 FlgL